jgi:cell division septal protein FtsQ
MPVAAPADKRFRRTQAKPVRRRRGVLLRALHAARVLVTFVCFVWGKYLLGHQVAHARSLHVDRIVVRGNARLSTRQVLDRLQGLRGEHVLHVDLDHWRRQVLASRWVEYVAIRRVLPSTIEVFVRERQPMAIGRVHDELYLVDAGGNIIDEYGPAYAQFDLPLVDGLSPQVAGQPMVDDRRAELAGRVIAALRRDDRLYRKVSQIVVNDEHDAAVILDGDRALVRLGEDQFKERLQMYLDLAPVLRAQVPVIDSVDLRIDGRVYVKPVRTALSARR